MILIVFGGWISKPVINSKFQLSKSNNASQAPQISAPKVSVNDALLSADTSFVCHIKKSSSGNEIAYIKARQIRIDSETNPGSEGLLVTHDQMYAWSSKGGVVIPLDAGAKGSVDEFQKQVSKLSALSGGEGFDTHGKECSPAQVDDIHFSVPSSIKFLNVSSFSR